MKNRAADNRFFFTGSLSYFYSAGFFCCNNRIGLSKMLPPA
jgi:hypothetical protein